MNFTKKGEDPSKIIRKYSHNNDLHKIQYLDLSYSEYLCPAKDEEQRIKKLMLEQALDRQKSIDIKAMESIKIIDSFLTWFCASETCLLISKHLDFLSFLMFAVSLICLRRVIITGKQIRELKKYKLFFEMIDDLDEINKSDILDCVEFEKIYQLSFDIENLDEYSLGDIKAIKKALQKTKQMENKKIID